MIVDITEDLMTASGDRSSRDWGITTHAEVDDQLRSDLREIREAELAAERSSSTLRIY